MHHLPRAGSLEIEQDLPFERTQWRLQRAGWAIGVLILLAALAGLLGTGPLSHPETSSGPLMLQYERFARASTATDLHLDVAPGLAAPGEITIWLDRAFVDKAGIEHVIPEPIEMAVAGDRVLSLFNVVDPTQPASITFRIEPASWGIAHGRIGLPDGVELTFDQVICP